MEAGDRGENSNSFQYMIELGGGGGVYDRMYFLLIRECSTKNNEQKCRPVGNRLRAVSYFSLQSYCAKKPKPR